MCTRSETDIRQVIEKACELGCCLRCGLCYLGLMKMNIAMYAKKETELLEALLPESIKESPVSLLQTRCRVCFGAFQDEYLHSRIPDQMEKIYLEYQVDHVNMFHVSLSFSHHFHLREHCFKYILCNAITSEQVQAFLKSTDPPLDRKRLMKTTLSDIFEKNMIAKGRNLKACTQTAPLMIDVKIEDDTLLKACGLGSADEILSPHKKKRKQSKNDRKANTNLQSILKIQSLDELTSTIDAEMPKEWKDNLEDLSSTNSIECDKKFMMVSGVHSVIYISGYYRKLERGLPQSPWVMRGSKDEEQDTRSVDTYIGEPFMRYTKADSYKFDSCRFVQV